MRAEASRLLARVPARIIGSLLLLFLAACGSGAPAIDSAQPRLVVLYTACTLNKDYLQPYDA